MPRDQLRVILAAFLCVVVLTLTPSRFWLPIGVGLGLLLLLPLARWIWNVYHDVKHAPAAAALRREKILTANFPTGNNIGEPSVATGVAIEWSVGERLSTLVVLDDGTTSLYFLPRSAFVGLARFENIARAASAFRVQSQRVRSHLAPATTFPIPAPNQVIFYAIGQSSTLSSGELDVGAVEREQHPFFFVLRAARELMREISRVWGIDPTKQTDRIGQQ